MGRIYLSAPHMEGGERELLLDAFDSNWIAPLGPHVDGFERELSEAVGVGHAAALSSGTGGLHLALLIAGVQPGDLVVTSTLTFVATANAIRYVGAQPVFVDSESTSWTLDADLLAEYLEDANKNNCLPKCVLTVDLYGQCPDYDRIQAICAQYEIPIVEDAAEGLGSTLNGAHAGSFGDFGLFSFNGNKIITCGGGGMLVSNREDWIQSARHLSTQAREPVPHYEHVVVGFNYRMSNLLAAVGRGQLRHLESKVNKRRAIRERYVAALGELPGVHFLLDRPGMRSNAWLTCLTVDPSRLGVSREDIRLALGAQEIEARPVWKPMHSQPVYRDCPSVGTEVSDHLFETGLCLASGSCLTEADQDRIIDIVLSMPGLQSA